ncbi:MAG: UDP-N-acetylglucosamine 1-carboxyvinyltransferase [Planctomycetes bacterium]|nr:UDP-N-acetylglucosamine 1-carboxyvinyltransferase [Planctomycetota bacterium]
MDKFVVEGGRTLRGKVRVGGSKNAVLPVLAASLLTDEPLVIPNAPRLSDVESMLDVLRDLGSTATRRSDGAVLVQSAATPSDCASWDHVRRMRGSISVLGPLVARNGRAVVSQPGGCVIGVRPIDLHLKGLRALGAKIETEHGYVVAEAPKGGLKGDEMYLGGAQGSTVLGTANVMMAATLARGRTVIHGAACEPEVVDLGDCLNKMGAKISGLGSPRIVIEGVDQLGGATHAVIPDRIEAGTFLIAGAMTGGAVRVENCRPDHLTVLLERLGEARVPFQQGKDWIASVPYDVRDRARAPRPTDVTTLPYPAFPTDLQAQWMALMTLADGMSVITETIYTDRYMHVAEMMRLGATIRRQGASSIVLGPAPLSGAPVMASDLRASAALVLAALVARGTTEIHRVYHIDRGYERIEERLRALGADIKRVDENEPAGTDDAPLAGAGSNAVLQPKGPKAPKASNPTTPAARPRPAKTR